MENKQEIILNLVREMLRLMFKLTFVSNTKITDTYEIYEIKNLIRFVRYKLDEFEKEFLKEDAKEDENAKQG